MHTRRRASSNDEGETLIEVLFAVAIMGITVVALVGGIATTILMSDMHRKQATAGACVRNYAEAVAAYVAADSPASQANFEKDATPDYSSSTIGFTAPTGQLPCDVNSDDALPHPARFVTTKPPVLCWVDTQFSDSCPTASVEQHAVQQLTLNVASADSVAGQRGASESLVVVVRKP
jgi:Tfp pilus assembly protein PilV